LKLYFKTLERILKVSSLNKLRKKFEKIKKLSIKTLERKFEVSSKNGLRKNFEIIFKDS